MGKRIPDWLAVVIMIGTTAALAFLLYAMVAWWEF